MFMVHVVAGVFIAIVAGVGVMRVRRVVGVRIRRVRQRRVAVAVPCARAVRRAPAVLAVVAAVHGALRARRRTRSPPPTSSPSRAPPHHRTRALNNPTTMQLNSTSS